MTENTRTDFMQGVIDERYHMASSLTQLRNRYPKFGFLNRDFLTVMYGHNLLRTPDHAHVATLSGHDGGMVTCLATNTAGTMLYSGSSEETTIRGMCTRP